MPSNCGAGEDSWGLSHQSILKEVALNIIGRTDAKAEGPILWPPDGKSQLTGQDPDAGKDRRQNEKRATEDDC